MPCKLKFFASIGVPVTDLKIEPAGCDNSNPI